MPDDAEIIRLFVFRSGENKSLLLYSQAGRGFRINQSDVVAQTKSGKQILNVGRSRAAGCLCITGDTVAVIGENRKLLIFPLEELPQMARGKGVILQKYRQGGLSDIKTFTLGEGLKWKLGEKTRTQLDLLPWKGKRAGQGRLPPVGFPKSNTFGEN